VSDAGEYKPLVSVIIPVKNGAVTLDACLRSIRRSYYKNYEVIVVDDHSTDGTVEAAQRHKCQVLEVANGQGANNARNMGAEIAKGELLVFIDSDIVIGRETLLGIVEAMEASGLDAVVGIYTARHRHERFVSQYKNLWIRYSYMKSLPAIDWLFGAISGIRREAFQKLGGFDAELLARDGHDDIELGKRFTRANLSIALDMDIEVEHLKDYTLRTFILNEYRRSLGFAEMAMRFGEFSRSLKKGFVNVYPMFVISTLIPLLIAGLLIGGLGGWIPDWKLSLGVVVALYLLMNIRFLNYLEQVRGLFAMIVMIPFLFIDHVVCLVGSVVGTIRGLSKRKSGHAPV
jgi:glycosyltransferase involved in cell wall biosynthesis